MSNTTNLNLFKHDNPEQNTNAFDIEKALNENWDKIDDKSGNIDTNISNIQTEQTEQNNRLSALEEDNTTNKSNIQTNTNNITSLGNRVTTNEGDIRNINTTVGTIQTEQTTQNNKISALERDNETNKTSIATLQTDSGHTIFLELNNTTYVLTATLKNKAGTILNTSSIDLPVEQLVVSVTYDSSTKELVITLKNGQVTRVPLGDLISGLQTEITSSNKLSSDLVDDTYNLNKFVTTNEKENWNAKYNKPNAGIPKTDLSNEVQTSLGKADTALQQHQDISGKEDKSNKVTSIDNTNTDIQYPSAKSVYDSQQSQNEKIEKLEVENARLKATLPTTKETGGSITLDKTAEMEFVVPPLPEGNTYQETTTGKNLYNKNTAFVEGNNLQNIANITTLDTNTDYTFYANEQTWVTAQLYNSNNQLTRTIGATNTSKIINFTTANDEVKAKLIFYTGNNTVIANYNFNNVMLVKGTYTSSTILPYESYSGGYASPSSFWEQEIQVVKGDVEVDISGRNKYNKNDSNSIIEGYFDTSVFRLNSAGRIVFIKCSPKTTYTISKTKDQRFAVATTRENPNDGIDHSIYGLIGNNYGTTITITTEEQAKYLLVFYYFSGASLKTEEEIRNSIQIELGENANTYSEYQGRALLPLTLGNIELCKIGDYIDKFEKDNGVWKIPNKILKIDSYNGETITTPYISSTGGLDIGATVYYVGDNDLAITDTTLIGQLEAINNAISYYEQTNISGTSSGINPLFDVEAYQNTKLILENLDNRLSLIEG